MPITFSVQEDLNDPVNRSFEVSVKIPEEHSPCYSYFDKRITDSFPFEYDIIILEEADPCEAEVSFTQNIGYAVPYSGNTPDVVRVNLIAVNASGNTTHVNTTEIQVEDGTGGG